MNTTQTSAAVGELTRFLELVLPENGLYISVGLTKGRPLKNKFHQKLESIIPATQGIRSHVDWYFATASFKTTEGGRFSENAFLRRCIVADLDCGDGKPYPDKRAALTGLQGFLEATGFPTPSALVDSGGGLHVYWATVADMTLARWQVLADGFRDLAVDHGFYIDGKCTVDSVRVLRVPGTTNFKTSPGRPVRLLRCLAAHEYKTLLEAVRKAPSADPGAISTGLPAVDNADLISGSQDSFVAFAAEIEKSCGVLQEAVETGGKDHGNELWSSLLWLLAFCEDGESYAHKIGHAHPTYKARDTEYQFKAKLQAKERTDKGATLCSTFSKLSSQCATCPLNGKIRSPIAVGRPKTDDTDETTPPFPWCELQGQMCIRDGGEITRVVPFPIRKLQLFDPSGGRSNQDQGLEFRVTILLRGKERVITFNHVETQELREFKLAVAHAQIILNDQQVGGFKTLLTSWAQRLNQIGAVHDYDPRYGWSDVRGERCFNTGSKILKPDGSEISTHFKNRHFRDTYSPVGNTTDWSEVANALISRGDMAINTALAACFAAPLMEFTANSGCVISITSPESGTGKSMVLKAGAAIWGHPRLSVNALDDTEASIVERTAVLRNLPMLWDEIRQDDEVTRLVNLTFRLSQGRSKARLSANAKMKDVSTWKTLLVVAGNRQLEDRIIEATKGTDAGQARILEVPVGPMPQSVDRGKSERYDYLLEQNYGVAGEAYARYLVANRVSIEQRVHQLVHHYDNKFKLDSAQRFRVAAIATITLGMVIANHLKLTNFPITDVVEFLSGYLTYASVSPQAKEQLSMRDRSVRMLREFMEDHQARTYMVNGMSMGGKRQPNFQVVAMPPRERDAPTICRTEDASCVIISAAALKAWLSKGHFMPLPPFIDQLQSAGFRIQLQTFRLGSGIPTLSPVPVRALIINPPTAFRADFAETI